ncbi:phosphoenolpyruvate carboxykinase (ATP) [Halobacteriales archaeon QS_1_68_20]|nr:MAG: phosphoenolpyruvate carboxykinase (ATP) [Halobacteriales archaeon QS_1_68_20]
MSETGLDRTDLVRRLPTPESEGVVYDPSFERLREFSSHLETTTEYGSPSYVSEYRSRCADRTKNAVDDEFTQADWDAVDEAVAAAGEREMVCLDRMVGRHPEVAQCCRLYVPKEYGRIALAWGKLLEPAPEDREPDLYTVQLPDRDEVAIRVLPEEGLTVVLGSDYTGEAKKSFLRLYMRRAKERGGLGLHAGSKRVVLQDDDEMETVGQLFLGLSGTGKSTLTGHGFWLDDPEYAEMLQDDVCALLPDGTVAGSEGGGLYIKTMGLDADEQPALHHAATQSSAVLENVAVDEDGTVDFDDGELTTNGRAVVRREDLPSAADGIDLPDVDQVFFITRNPLMAPVSRLTDAQAAAAFMLGESVQTSAGDPEKAGERIRVVGTNPFIVGPEGEEGNRFRELIRENDVECYLLNTGTVGDRDVGVEETVGILEAIARDQVEWDHDEAVGLDLPTDVPGVDISAFHPAENVTDYDEKVHELRVERRAYLSRFDALDEEIRDAAY